MSPSALIITLIRGKLLIYTLKNPMRYSECQSLTKAKVSMLGYFLSSWTCCLHSLKKGKQNMSFLTITKIGENSNAGYCECKS